MPSQIGRKELVEWSTAGLVLLSGAMAGHYAAMGMNPVQWAGAAMAVLGSVTVAVTVRVWPSQAKAEAKRD